MSYLILDSSLTWTECRNRSQWRNASAMGVQVVMDTDQAIDWYAGGVVSEGDLHRPEGNPPWVATGFDFYVWRPGQAAPEAVGLLGLTLYLRAQGVVGSGEGPLHASMDALQAAGVKFGANVSKEEWDAVIAAVAAYPAAPPPVAVVPTGLSVLYYTLGRRAEVRNRADWAAAPSFGLLLCAHEHPAVGWYAEGSPEVKIRSRVPDAPWALQSGGVETWPLDQPRPWQTDVFGMWQDLIRDGAVSSSVPLRDMTLQQLVAAGAKFWADEERDRWQTAYAYLLADNGTVLPAWGSRG